MIATGLHMHDTRHMASNAMQVKYTNACTVAELLQVYKRATQRVLKQRDIAWYQQQKMNSATYL